MKPHFSTLKHLITLVFITSFFSCGNNPLDIDVDHIKLDLNIKRFDQNLFEYKNGITPNQITEINAKYGIFFNDFTQSVISIGSIKNPSINQLLNAFINDQGLY